MGKNEGVCECVRFDWGTLGPLPGAAFRTFSSGEFIIEDGDGEEKIVYRVVEGAVQVHLGETTWTVSASDYWPLFGVMSAFGKQKSSTLTVVATTSPCMIELIPTLSLVNRLFETPDKCDLACLFFESMCRFYASRLKSVPQKTFFRNKSSVYRGCFSINGEMVIYSTKVSLFSSSSLLLCSALLSSNPLLLFFCSSVLLFLCSPLLFLSSSPSCLQKPFDK